jgi:hypothetical protein
MKTLILAGEGAIQQVRISYAETLSYLGFQCIVWHPNSGKPLFDMFNDFEPEIVFCGSWEVDRPLYKNLMNRPHIKVILWGANWGSYDKEIDTKVDPVLMASQENMPYIEDIIKNNNIKHVFSYYSQRWVNITHDKWHNVGLEPIGLPLAADLINQGVVEPVDALKCDVSFLGGYWPYKAINLNSFLVPLCHPQEKLKVKIFGYGGWPVAQHLGTIETNALPSLIASTTVNVNIFEPLAQKYGFDVNERCYKTLACGGFCISEYCDSAAKDIFINNEVVFAKTPQEFKDKVKYFVAHPSEREDYIKRGLVTARTEHNYFKRVQTLLPLLKLDNPKFMQKIDSTLDEVKNK